MNTKITEENKIPLCIYTLLLTNKKEVIKYIAI